MKPERGDKDDQKHVYYIHEFVPIRSLVAYIMWLLFWFFSLHFLPLLFTTFSLYALLWLIIYYFKVLFLLNQIESTTQLLKSQVIHFIARLMASCGHLKKEKARAHIIPIRNKQ